MNEKEIAAAICKAVNKMFKGQSFKGLFSAGGVVSHKPSVVGERGVEHVIGHGVFVGIDLASKPDISVEYEVTLSPDGMRLYNFDVANSSTYRK